MSPSRSDTGIDVTADPLRPGDHADSESATEITQPALGVTGWLRWAWRQLTSMRTALVLLLLLAVADYVLLACSLLLATHVRFWPHPDDLWIGIGVLCRSIRTVRPRDSVTSHSKLCPGKGNRNWKSDEKSLLWIPPAHSQAEEPCDLSERRIDPAKIGQKLMEQVFQRGKFPE